VLVGLSGFFVTFDIERFKYHLSAGLHATVSIQRLKSVSRNC
jgi:hypothetical protein